ncbi:MAG: secondary thiamine-phosphate synthase enzyme YjbQ [Gammaproteobacteria bacterium]|nr:secondary thiamine-phosphate synthase enzyme YjbQ [Gammaproteobacteria bacterium]
MFSKKISIPTKGRGSYDITHSVQELSRASGITQGICNLFVHHTSASVILCENADPAVRDDLERFMARLVPDGDPAFDHIDEGPDDMPAHIRTILTQSSLSIPISSGRCDLGTWQGVYLLEHRTHPHNRKLTVTIMGD